MMTGTTRLQVPTRPAAPVLLNGVTRCCMICAAWLVVSYLVTPASRAGSLLCYEGNRSWRRGAVARWRVRAFRVLQKRQLL